MDPAMNCGATVPGALLMQEILVLFERRASSWPKAYLDKSRLSGFYVSLWAIESVLAASERYRSFVCWFRIRYIRSGYFFKLVM